MNENDDGILISAGSLSVGYTFPVIKEICFNVRGGQILSLLGPNGSGKSTLLRTLARELESLGGNVVLCGKELSAYTDRERARILAALMTERTVPDLMTCREVVEMGRYPMTGYFGRLSESDKAAVQRAVNATGMEDIAGTDFSAVSDGQRQRVLLARAICQEPRVLLLDEPTSYLDIYHKIMFFETLRSLVREKRIAVIMSIHEPEFAKKISDHVICIKNGGIYSEGVPDEIFVKENICGLFGIPEDLYDKYTD